MQPRRITFLTARHFRLQVVCQPRQHLHAVRRILPQASPRKGIARYNEEPNRDTFLIRRGVPPPGERGANDRHRLSLIAGRTTVPIVSRRGSISRPRRARSPSARDLATTAHRLTWPASGGLPETRNAIGPVVTGETLLEPFGADDARNRQGRSSSGMSIEWTTVALRQRRLQEREVATWRRQSSLATCHRRPSTARTCGGGAAWRRHFRRSTRRSDGQ